MSERYGFGIPDAGKAAIMLGEQPVDLTELGNILTNAGESIAACFGTADSANAYRCRAETAEAKLAQLADLVNFHGTMMRSNGVDVVCLHWGHLAKILNGGCDE